MDSAPGIPTWVDGIGGNEIDNNLMPTDHTAVLNEQLNSMVEQVPTTPFYQRAVVLQNAMMGLEDTMYNVGYHQLPVDNQVAPQGYRYESPEVPVTNKPWTQSLYNTTLVQEQVGPIVLYQSYRAPEINEGFQAQ